MPRRAPAILRQCRVLRESPRGSCKYPNCSSYSLRDWRASDNLRGTPCGSRNVPNVGRSPTCRLWTADTNSHMPYQGHATLKPWFWEVAFRTAWSRHCTGAVWARHGMCESNTASLCKSNGKDTNQTLSGTAWQGNDMVVARKRHGICELAFTIRCCKKLSSYRKCHCRFNTSCGTHDGIKWYSVCTSCSVKFNQLVNKKLRLSYCNTSSKQVTTPKWYKTTTHTPWRFHKKWMWAETLLWKA
jgi:hypothetical protein